MKKIIGIAGWSGSGKTTLVEGLVDIFKNNYNLKVCAIKHAHKNFTIDQEGKDSFRFSKAGAERVIVSSINQWTIINKVQEEESIENLLKLNEYNSILINKNPFTEPQLGKRNLYDSLNNNSLIKFTKNFNIVLVEGWKFSKLKKIEVHRNIIKKKVLFEEDKNIIAIATDNLNLVVDKKLKKLNLNDHLNIAKFIINKNFGVYND